MKTKSCAIIAASVLAPFANADIVTIDFDTDALGFVVPEGSTLGSQYASKGVIFNSGTTSSEPAAFIQNKPLYRGQFSAKTDLTITRTETGGGVDHAAMGNVLRTYSGWGRETGDPVFEMLLTQPMGRVDVTFVGDSSGASAIFAYRQNILLGIVQPGATPVNIADVASFTDAGGIDKLVIVPGSYYDWTGVSEVKLMTVPAPGAAASVGLLFAFAFRRSR